MCERQASNMTFGPTLYPQKRYVSSLVFSTRMSVLTAPKYTSRFDHHAGAGLKIRKSLSYIVRRLKKSVERMFIGGTLKAPIFERTQRHCTPAVHRLGCIPYDYCQHYIELGIKVAGISYGLPALYEGSF